MSQNNLFQTTEPADLTLLAIAENTQKEIVYYQTNTDKVNNVNYYLYVTIVFLSIVIFFMTIRTIITYFSKAKAK